MKRNPVKYRTLTVVCKSINHRVILLQKLSNFLKSFSIIEVDMFISIHPLIFGFGLILFLKYFLVEWGLGIRFDKGEGLCIEKKY